MRLCMCWKPPTSGPRRNIAGLESCTFNFSLSYQSYRYNTQVFDMATLTDHGHNLQPVCQNCTTSTTPLWRRDEMGSVLCNACGLFLKLHGTPRPISLKTDVIKSRNRVKTAGQGQKRKASNPRICAYSLLIFAISHCLTAMAFQRPSQKWEHPHQTI